MQANVYWIDGVGNGRLGIVPRPRGGEWLEDEAAAWRDAGVEMVVSLLEPAEAADLLLQEEATAAAASGITLRNFPIPDRGVPSSREAVAEVTREIIGALDAPRSVAVHCRQSVGRAGMIAVAVLVARGTPLDAALQVVSEARGIEVPETPEQRRWLEDFARWLDQTRAAESSRPARERAR